MNLAAVVSDFEERPRGTLFDCVLPRARTFLQVRHCEFFAVGRVFFVQSVELPARV